MSPILQTKYEMARSQSDIEIAPDVVHEQAQQNSELAQDLKSTSDGLNQQAADLAGSIKRFSS